MITGHFDTVLAEKWIDYLFGDWTGTAAAMPREPAPKGQPAALAMASDSTLTRLQIALPSDSGTRAQRLVAAAMLGELARDVRHQMGAAYSVDASLVERRRASRYMVVGYIDSTRAADAMKFLRDGLANLATDREAASRAFVLARKRVLVQLRSVAGSAAALAARLEHDVELARAPLTDLATAREVQALTFDRMGAVLAELNLNRAVVLARGPQHELTRVFEVLGRTPTVLSFDTAAADAASDDPLEEPTAKPRERKRITVADLEDALTDDPAVNWRLALRLAAGGIWANTINRTVGVHETCCIGYGAAAYVGLRYDRQKSFGVYLSLASLEGDYYIGLASDQRHRVREIPIDVALAFEGSAYDRLWGSVFLGLHLDRKTRTADDKDAWRGSLAVGLQAGADAVSIAGHRLGIFVHFGGTLGGPVGYGAIGAGVAYRY